jgi:hypothetical protein
MAQKKFIIDGGFKTTDDSIIEANLEMTGHILPTVDSDGTTGFDLGSTTKKWRDLYLSEGSLYIDGQKVIESNSGTIVVQADPDQSLTTQVSGSGVLTLTSATTISMNGTLQMASGKKITDVNGDNVVFGDKIDMDSNKIVNVGSPTANTDAATKAYVDGLVGNIATDAITEGDSELEIADLGTGTVGITVDGTQRFALSASSLAMTVPITINGVNVATETYADTAEADAKAYTDTQIAALDFNNVSGGIAVTGGALSVGANADVELSASSELKSGSSTIVGDDPDNAGNPAVCASSFRPTAAVSDLNLRPNNGGAISLDGGDVEYAGVGIVGDDPDNAGSPTVCASTFRPSTGTTDLNLRPGTGGAVTFGSNVLEGVATPVGGTDAANKTYVDTVVANLVNAAPSDLDTLNELAAALGDDANFASTVTTSLGTKAATTYVDAQDTATLNAAAADATTKAAAAQTAAEATATTKANDAQAAAASDATSKANAAQTAAEAYTDTREAIMQTTWETYGDVAEQDAINTAAADATVKADNAQAAAEATASADATTKADAAEAAAITHCEADATSKANAAQAAAASDATSKADAAEAAAITHCEADATSKANAAQAAAEATASADATAKVSAEASARTTAIANAVAGIEANISTSTFHSTVTDVTNASTVAYTFSDLVGADDYTVYVNRLLTRPAELSSVNTSTGVVTFAADVIEVGDEIEVKGWKLVS